MKKLSLLICSLVSRKEKLDELLLTLNPQINDDVEIIINVDNKEKTVGKKRNELLEKSQGEYISFIDDDDLVSNDYVNKILTAVADSPDCCGMEGIITFNGNNPKKFIHSLLYKTWFEKDGIYYRNPNHLSPVKREYAIITGFKEINFGEDRDYSDRLLPLLKTESYIEQPIYFYKYIHSESETVNIDTHKQVLYGDFNIRSKISISSLSKSAAAFVIDGCNFGFEGKSGSMFFEGYMFEKSILSFKGKKIIVDSKVFDFEIKRHSNIVDFFIDGIKIVSGTVDKAALCMYFKPSRSNINIKSFIVK